MGTVHDWVLPATLASADNLPSLPQVAVEVLQLSETEDAGLDDYASVISSDPALTARILKLANSSLFSLGQEVTTLQRATMVLGTKTVQLMALSFSLVGQLRRQGTNSRFDYGEYWKRSLTAAVAGRELGRLLGFNLGDEAFLCGLLSRIGQLVMAECMAEEYAGVIERSERLPTRDLERKTLGFDHADIGAALMSAWGLPEPLFLTVGFQYDPAQLPEEANQPTQRLTRIAQLASLIVGVLCDTEKGDLLDELHTYAGELGLSSEQVDTLILALEVRIDETAKLLEIELENEYSHYEILDTARKQLVALSVEAVTQIREIERRASHVESDNRSLVTADNTDELTGLGDRSFLDAVLAREVNNRMYGRVPGQLGLVLVELSNHDAIAANHGPGQADEALHLIGQVLRGVSRSSDAPARFGERVFAVLVPACQSLSLKVLGERLGSSASRIQLPAGQESFPVQVVVGAATVAEVASLRDGKKLVELAESALDRARSSGPGTVELQTD